ncbi:class GN sortase [Maricaulis parjimensis]|uniref:class GN sortase n=1 Tax=Maricaulis parjimensis TaxID=144023 RepID=UPI00193A1059
MTRSNLLRGGAITCLAAGALALAQGLWIPVKADIAQLLLAQAWTRAIDGESAPTPWPWADTWPVARLSVPELGEHAIVLAEAGGEALAFGPSLLSQSVRPGENGVSVIAAHRDTHFAFLRDVEPGQTIVVERPDGPPALFRVTGSEIVDANRSGIQVAGGEPRLALVTCWPFGSITPGPLRYVVWAESVDMNRI